MSLVTSGRASDQCFCAPEKSEYHGSHASWKDLESSGIFPLLQGPGKFWKSNVKVLEKSEFAVFQIWQICITPCMCSVNNNQSMVYFILHPLLYTAVTMFLKCSVINSCCFSLNLDFIVFLCVYAFFGVFCVFFSHFCVYTCFYDVLH